MVQRFFNAAVPVQNQGAATGFSKTEFSKWSMPQNQPFRLIAVVRRLAVLEPVSVLTALRESWSDGYFVTIHRRRRFKGCPGRRFSRFRAGVSPIVKQSATGRHPSGGV